MEYNLRGKMLKEWLVLLLEMTARFVAPRAEEKLARFACRLLPDVPLLSGHWTVEFRDPLPTGDSQAACLLVQLDQFGRRMTGRGFLRDQPSETFVFHATIRRNVLYGSYRRNDPHVLGGTGTFVLKITALSRRLEGQCLWYDALLDDVWVSPYSWNRTERSQGAG